MKRPTFASSSAASTSSSTQNGAGRTSSIANSSATAVSARSPPESIASACGFLPGGRAVISMPVVARSAGSVSESFAKPPPNSCWNRASNASSSAANSCRCSTWSRWVVAHAHSFVRGHWRRQDTSAPMLLAKSCHDVDWLVHLFGRPPARVSSFGSLSHFRPEERPATAADRCVDCPLEPSCPYSAPRLYLGCLGDADSEFWPLSAVTQGRTEEEVLRALRTGPYGRCVYACDNDVVDHQEVAMEFDDGATCSFTMSAFTRWSTGAPACSAPTATSTATGTSCGWWTSAPARCLATRSRPVGADAARGRR